MSGRLVYVSSKQLRRECDRIPAVKKRASMVHELITAYDLDTFFDVVEPRAATASELRLFHSADYVTCLQTLVQKEEVHKSASESDSDEDDGNDDADESTEDDDTLDDGQQQRLHNFGLGYDCPPLRNLWPLATTVAGATVTAAVECMRGARVVINWCGGWHHAQRGAAEGFCYVNDIGCGIRKLRERFERILYVDLDVHHGNGVETGFAHSRSVFTLSFHQYEAGFYPGSGGVEAAGERGTAPGYMCNFPYKGYVGGVLFRRYFEKVTESVRRAFRPDVCVLQCGGDALAGDPRGGTNLAAADLAACVRHVLDWQVPTILLGGGGYQLPNTARYWAYLTAVVCGRENELDDDIPDNRFFLAYGPGYELGVKRATDEVALVCRPDDRNTEEEFESMWRQIEDNLIKYISSPQCSQL